MKESRQPTLEEMDVRNNDHFVIQRLHNKSLSEDRLSDCSKKSKVEQADKILQTDEIDKSIASGYTQRTESNIKTRRLDENFTNKGQE